MSVKAIVDEHFEKRYNYYKTVAFNYCKDADTAYEITHELYFLLLKVKNETIEKFSKANALHQIGLRIICSLWYKRFNIKRYDKGTTSSLFITGNSTNFIDVNNVLIKESKDEDIEDVLSILESNIIEMLNSKDQSSNITIFLQANATSINEIHKHSGISRFFLTKSYNDAKSELKKRINEKSH
jgi:hypothetical protein